MTSQSNYDLEEDEEVCSKWLDSEEVETTKKSSLHESSITAVKHGRGESFKSTFGFLSEANDSNDGNKLSNDVMSTAQASALGSGKAIIVSPCQKGNPVLELIHGVPWKFADSNLGLAVDYVLSPSTGCLFLSLRYHSLKPDYIYERLKVLRQGGFFALRLLLCLVDVKDSTHAVTELTKVCLVSDVTLLLAFSNDEAATYLETFKAYQNKPADALKSKPAANHHVRTAEVLAHVRSVNSTDANTLLNNFGSFSEISRASEEDLALCPGIGGKKAKFLHNVFDEPFLRKKGS